jgi:hypothetical protein
MNGLVVASEVASRVAAGKKFGRYKAETGQEMRQVAVEESEIQNRFRRIFERTNHSNYRTNYSFFGYGLRDMAREGLEYTAADVGMLSSQIGSCGLRTNDFHKAFWDGARMGLFLSALINNGTETDYTLFLENCTARIHAIGYHNIKNIRIIGNAGGQIGIGMQKGIIVVEGDVGFSVGCSMEGGEIHVEGEFVDRNDVNWGPRDVIGGKIFHKGKLIVDKLFSCN